MTAALNAYATGGRLPNEAAVVGEHLELVRRIAWHLAARLPASVDVDDLVQAGIIGLIEAARHYNGDRGASFETYAGIRIRGAMVDELRRSDWAPRSVHRRMREVSAAIRSIEQETGREAREAEIIAKLGTSSEEYHAIVSDAVQCQVLSMDSPGHDDEDDRSIEAVASDARPDESLERDAFQLALAKAIDSLPERERQVMSMYYDDELNLREIGSVLGVTESRVCQLHGQALLRLRAKLSAWSDRLPAPVNKPRAARRNSHSLPVPRVESAELQPQLN